MYRTVNFMFGVLVLVLTCVAAAVDVATGTSLDVC